MTEILLVFSFTKWGQLQRLIVKIEGIISELLAQKLSQDSTWMVALIKDILRKIIGKINYKFKVIFLEF